MSSGKGRILWIDIARVLAIVLIVGFHVAYEFSLDSSIRWVGFLGASLFFIISGFMLAKHDPDLVSFDKGWFVRRYIRIASLYYPTIIVLVILFGAQIYDNGLWDIIAHFLFINGTWPALTYSIISPAWFIIPLFFFYVFYPYLNRFTKNYPFFVPLAVVCTIGARLLFGGLVNPNPFFFLAEFCSGIAFAHGIKDIWMLAPLALAFVSPVMALPFIMFFALSLLPSDEPNHTIGLAFSQIGQHTFEIFLFHESVMKAILGKWKVFNLDAAACTIILLLSLAIVVMVSKAVNSHTMKKSGAKMG